MAEAAGSREQEGMFFVEPRQLLNIYSQLEEQNLFLIQNAQESEEALEELRAKLRCAALLDAPLCHAQLPFCSRFLMPCSATSYEPSSQSQEASVMGNGHGSMVCTPACCLS